MEKIKELFFKFKYEQKFGEAFSISSQSEIVSQTDGYAEEYVRKVISGLPQEGRKVKILLALGYPEELKSKIGGAFIYNSESYAICVTDDKICMYAEGKRGLIYAAAELERIIKADVLEKMIIFDYPDKPVRGYRIFTPGENEIDIFKKMIDMIVYYKYNTVMIEVGGAMEYKRRPEINREWVKYCAEVNKSPYEAARIQFKTFTWSKNSIHTNNGAGGFISQECMKMIIAYCRERGLEVIPEVPSLSHSDYIVRTYRDLNERAEDTYPDTYCPSNPKSYEVLFDILDEVIEVFEPKYINIGHDESYTFAKCDKCRGKNPVDLFVGDIVKIHDYLEQKGIKTMMWGEKVYGNVYTIDADGSKIPEGGTGNAARDIPRLAECAGRIPKDITLIQWYWSLCTYEDEKNIIDMGYKMIYGNFQAIKLKNYRERISNVDGGFVSNWGSVEEMYMQRNGQNYSLLTTAYIFWNDKYDNSMSEVLHEKVKTELYNRYKDTLGDNIIELEHTTDYNKGYKAFYDGYYIVPEDWVIGWHVVEYEDGTTANLPVVYGYNIRGNKKTPVQSLSLGEVEANVSEDIEIIGAAYPVMYGEKVFYRTAYTNPSPNKKIKGITYKTKDGILVEVK